MSNFQWIAALSRMISAVMRKGGDLTFAIEELMATFDPAGGAWVEGAYVPSTVAYIGIVIERHLQSLGLLPKKEAAAPQIENPPKGGYCNKCHSYSVVKQEGCDICVNCGASKCG
jgi:ribonucleoside-diphosphate reductase alpha chain